MKKIKIIAGLAALLLTVVLASCEMKEELKGNDGASDTSVPSEVGYLDLSKVDLVSKSEASRADTVDSDDSSINVNEFPVEIVGTDVEYTRTFDSYQQMLDESPITLPVGNYKVSAHSKGELQPVMDEPYYDGETSLTITKDVVSNAEVECKMANTKIQIAYDEKFKETFQSWEITVTDGTEHNLIYDQEDMDPEPKYWVLQENVKVIKVYITAVTTGNIKITESRSITKPEDADTEFWVRADDLTITMEPGDTDPNTPSGINGIDIKVEVSFGTDKEEIEFIPVEDDEDTTEPGEPGDTDTDESAGSAPSIAIPQSTYTLPGDAEKNADATITAQAGIKSVKVQIVPGNEEFTEIVSEMFGTAPFELIGNETLGKVFSGMGISLPSKGATKYIFPVGNFFSILSGMGATTSSSGHVFKITVEDSEGKTASASLGVIVK
ncbi:MAG: DUF4493 domain-containing protein [Bacteroides sp.]|nr:DUF4493 domain-containing protein [Bacteroides sp.]